MKAQRTTVVEAREPKNRLDESLDDNAVQPNAEPTLMKEAILDWRERDIRCKGRASN